MEGGGGGSNWRPSPQGDPVPEVVGPNNDWRAQFPPESRHCIICKIRDTLKRHMSISAPEGLDKLSSIALRFEEKIYNAATSQADYLRKVSMKMLAMDHKSSNIANQNSPDAAKQMPSMVMPMPGQLVPTSMALTLSSMAGFNQSNIANIGPDSNIQALPAILQNSQTGQGVVSNLYADTQRQLQGRQLQQPIVHPSLLQAQMSQQQQSQSVMQVTSGLQMNETSLRNKESSVLQPISQNVRRNQQNYSQQGPISIHQQNASMHQQQQLGTHTNVHGLQQQLQQQQNQQQHPQTSHMLQHPGTSGQVPQTPSALLQMQGQQSSQKQHMSQLQSHTQQTNTLQTASALKDVIEQQNQPLQTQRVLPPTTSVDSTVQATLAGSDVQEEIYQKIKSWKEMYYPDAREMYHKLTMKLQPHEGRVLPPGKQSDQLEKLRKYKISIEHLIHLLQLPKSSIHPSLKDKLPHYESKIIGLLSANRRRPPQGQQFQTTGVINQSMQQQPDNVVNPVQQMNAPTSVTPVQSTAVSSLQSESMYSTNQVGANSTQQNMKNALQPCSSMNSSQGNALNSLQQGDTRSIQKNNSGTLYQASINTQQLKGMNVYMQNTVNTLQSPVNPLQQNSNVLQNQQIKQEHQQQLMQAQQIKQQFQQRQLQQQIIQQQQMNQQQLKKPILQQPPRLQQQILQQNQVQQYAYDKAALQRQTCHHPQLKLGSSFSPQDLQVHSPSMSRHSSPQVEHQAGYSLIKTGTPLQSTTPPFVAPSPSTPLAPSPLPEDHEKQTSGTSSLLNSGNGGRQQSVPGQAQVQSLAVGTLGIPKSPLVGELDRLQPNMSTAFPGRAFSSEQPLERLLNAIKSSSPSVLSSAINDIASIVGMTDMITCAAPGNGSGAAVGEDVVATTKCRLQAWKFMLMDSSVKERKMKRHINAMQLNAVPYAERTNKSFKQTADVDTPDLESTRNSNPKRLKMEMSCFLHDEIRDINHQLIDTVVDFADDDIYSAAENGEGAVVKCTFHAVTLGPNLKSQLASAEASPTWSIRFLIPTKYPLCPPVLLDKIPMDLCSMESGDLFAKARLRFGVSLRGLSQKLSLKDMVRTWDVSAREVILEYAQQNGGGSFTSRYGAWENCLGA